MANYLSLDEAAERLGIPTDRLVELRSQGVLRGFRDGTSWKFPEDEINRVADDPDVKLMVDSSEDLFTDAGGSDIDLGIGSELLQGGGSDVNLIASAGEGSDVAIVAGDSGLLEMDSDELLVHDSGVDVSGRDLAIEPNSGSTGPVTDEELRKISEAHPDVVTPQKGRPSGTGSGSSLELGGEVGDVKLSSESDLSFTGPDSDDDSGEDLIGADLESDLDMLGSGLGVRLSSTPASSLELMSNLDESEGKSGDVPLMGSRGIDVLSELDLLSAEQKGSGLITGDSENLLGSSGLGSSIGADGFKDSDLGGLDDALADDDELVVADDDDDLVISSAGSDISVAGDSGINLMSPSDSGLSLESEPLDLAGSSISALDLGAELSDGGSGSGSGSDGSLVDFQADEEFQLSPSGVGLDADIESGSQVIEVEDSEAIAEPVEFADDAFAGAGGDVFASEPQGEGAFALGEDEGESISIDQSAVAMVGPAGAVSYEVPFSLMQCVTLMLILCIMGLGGMLMTDLVRNMWTYSEPSAPVSSLTDSLIGLFGWGQ